jgi:hypothetical protein
MFHPKYYRLIELLYVDAYDYVYAAYVGACFRYVQACWDKDYLHADEAWADVLIAQARAARAAAWSAVCHQSRRNDVRYRQLH